MEQEPQVTVPESAAAAHPVSGADHDGIAEPEPTADLAMALASRDIHLGPIIGRGAMSVVYRAFDAKHERSLAVKVLRADRTDRDALARWDREIGAVARLRHPNIVPLFDSGSTPGGSTYFVMPLAEGQSLEARLTQGSLPLAEAVHYAREVAEALAYAHAEGLIHRDVKPGNILLEGAHAVLADFGLNRPIDSLGSGPGRRTQVGMVIGTPAYMSPEQLTAGEAVDGRADLFGLGIVLYEMVTGRLPFPSTTMPGLMTERLSGSYESITDLRPGTPFLLQQIVGRALDPDPGKRYDRAEAMAADLALMEHQLSGAGMVGAAAVPRGRWPGWMALAVGLSALLVIALRWHPPPTLDPSHVVVADMRNETGDTTEASIGPLASDLISAGLTSVPGLRVINSDLVFGLHRNGREGSASSGRGQGLHALVDSARAGTIVSGTYYREGTRLTVFAEVLDAKTGGVLLDLGPLEGSFSHPDSVLEVVRDRVRDFLSTRQPPSRAS